MQAPVLAGADERSLPYEHPPRWTVRLQQPAVLRSLLGDRRAIRFDDKYTLSVGIENLLDEDPPCINAESDAPTATLFQFPTACSHMPVATGGDATYDPLGRRFFISMNDGF